MRTKGTTRTFLAIALAALTVGPLHSAAAADPVAKTETLYISAGCPGTGTCTSTRWLGKKAGDATSNFVTSVTPVDEVLYRATGSLNWRDYASDDSLRTAGYPLQASENITANVRLTSTGVAINDTVHARIEAQIGNQTVTFGPLEATATMTPSQTVDVPFVFDIPDNLEGKILKSATFYVALHGVNVQGGYINQAGGSTVTIPYWELPV